MSSCNRHPISNHVLSGIVNDYGGLKTVRNAYSELAFLLGSSEEADHEHISTLLTMINYQLESCINQLDKLLEN